MIFDIDKYKARIDGFYGLMERHADIADVKAGADKWTLKEMTAHLIDSASNNHQRIIRLQLSPRVVFPSYDTDEWKDATKINGYDFGELARFWKGYNYYLLHLVGGIDGGCLNNVWEADGQELTLKCVVEGYFESHIPQHIDLYNERVREISFFMNPNR